jgi:hypothetical protein
VQVDAMATAREAAAATLRCFEQRAGDHVLVPQLAAAACVALGRVDEAFGWLRQAVELA